MEIDSYDVNLLIYQYLKESNLDHSVFSFENETKIKNDCLEKENILPCSLLRFLHKGLEYSRLEYHLNQDGTESLCSEPFRIGKDHQCNITSKVKLAYYMESQGSLVKHDIESDGLNETSNINLKNIHIFKYHSEPISTFIQMPNNPSVCISGSLDCNLRGFDFKKLKDKIKMESIKSKDSKVESTVSDSGKEKRMDPKEISNLVQFPFFKNGFKTSLDKVSAIDSNSEGNHIVVGRVSGSIEVYKKIINQGKFSFEHIFTLPHGHEGLITSLIWSNLPDQDCILSSGMDKVIILWNLRLRKVVRRFLFHSNSIYSVVAYKDCGTFLSASADGSIRFFSVGLASPLRTLKGHTDEVNGVRFFEDGRNALSWSDDGTIKAWSLDAQNAVKMRVSLFGRNVIGRSSSDINKDDNKSNDFNVNKAGTKSEKHNLDNSISNNNFNDIKGNNFNLVEKENLPLSEFLIAEYDEHRAEVTNVEMTKCEKRFVSASNDFTAKLWDLDKCCSALNLSEHSHPITGLKILEEKKAIITGSYNGLKFFDMRSGKIIRSLRMRGGISDIMKVDEDTIAFVKGKDIVYLEV